MPVPEGPKNHLAQLGWIEERANLCSAQEWVRGDVHTQTIEGVWSLFKRSIIGSYHQLSVKHLPAYLDEMEWRYNNRDNPFLFRDTVLKLVEAEVLPYRTLVASHV